VNFTTNEEEKNSVGGNDDKSRDEESEETKQVVVNVAYTALLVVGIEITVAVCTSNDDTKSSGNTPAAKMVPLLKELRFSVSSHDHLVEVEGNAEGPAEVGNEHKVQNNCHENTSSCITRNPTSSSKNES